MKLTKPKIKRKRMDKLREIFVKADNNLSKENLINWLAVAFGYSEGIISNSDFYNDYLNFIIEQYKELKKEE